MKGFGACAGGIRFLRNYVSNESAKIRSNKERNVG